MFGTKFSAFFTGEGMSPAQREACDFFVYIPQHTGDVPDGFDLNLDSWHGTFRGTPGATASLNVAIAGSIVVSSGGVITAIKYVEMD